MNASERKKNQSLGLVLYYYQVRLKRIVGRIITALY